MNSENVTEGPGGVNIPVSNEDESPIIIKKERARMVLKPKLMYQNKLYTFVVEGKGGGKYYRCKYRRECNARIAVNKDNSVKILKDGRHTCLQGATPENIKVEHRGGEDVGGSLPVLEGDFCFLCCSKVKGPVENAEKKRNLLWKNLNIVFLLRHLMKVPESQLERNLMECGDPGSWISLCEKCEELNRQGMELGEKIRKMEEEMRSLQQLIRDKVVSSALPASSLINQGEIWRRTRDFITNYKYSNLFTSDPFKEGDNLASYLLNEKKTSTILLFPSENPKLEVEENEDDYHVEEPALPNPELIYVERQSKPIKVVKKRKAPVLKKKQVLKKAPVLNKERKKLSKTIRINGKWKCRHCDKLYATSNALYVHEAEKHPKIPPAQFICDICEKRWNSREFLRSHKRDVHRVKLDGTPYPPPPSPPGSPPPPPGSPPPPANLSMKPKLVRRKKGANGKWNCSECNDQFKTRQNLYHHLDRKHFKSPPGQVICDICGKAHNTKHQLSLHRLQTHQVKADGTPVQKKKSEVDQSPRICDICGKTIYSTAHLKMHLRIVHEKVYKFKCDLCGKGFGYVASLKYHLANSHPEESGSPSLWKCEVVGCARKFLRKKTLELHMSRVHGSESELAKFSCQICGKGFWRGHSLRTHLRIHQSGGRRDFQCDLCPTAFTTPDYVELHKRRVHKIWKRKNLTKPSEQN